jgi:hypothetical protein
MEPSQVCHQFLGFLDGSNRHQRAFSYDVKYILPPLNPERPVHIELSPVREFYDLGHLSHSEVTNVPA